MEAFDTTLSTEASTLQNIIEIERALNQIALEDPHNFSRRYTLLERYFMTTKAQMSPQERKEGVKALERLREELNKKIKRQESYFMQLSNEFETEIKTFIKEKINRR